jgi:hypothetical protein
LPCCFSLLGSVLDGLALMLLTTPILAADRD